MVLRALLGNMSTMIKRICWFALFYSVCIYSYVSAHPHVFIDNTVAIVFNKKGLEGIKTRWVFDEMFSNMIMHDYDKNQDGTFSAAETEKIKNEAFSNLKQFHYFTYIQIEGNEFIVQYVKDFSACLDSNRVVYTFFIPCHVLAVSSYKEIKIAMYDSTYYVDVSWVDKPPVHFEDGDSMEYKYQIDDNTKALYYYGQIAPQEIILNFRKKDEKE